MRITPAANGKPAEANIDRKGNPRADAGEYEIWIAPSAHKGTPVKCQFTP